MLVQSQSAVLFDLLGSVHGVQHGNKWIGIETSIKSTNECYSYFTLLAICYIAPVQLSTLSLSYTALISSPPLPLSRRAPPSSPHDAFNTLTIGTSTFSTLSARLSSPRLQLLSSSPFVLHPSFLPSCSSFGSVV